jgi:hypothetical protein
MPDPQFLECAERGPCCTTDVVRPRFQLVELLDDGQWHDDVVLTERMDAHRICDQHGRVEHDARPGAGDDAGAICDPVAIRRAARARGIAANLFGPDEIGHRHSSSASVGSASIGIPVGITWFEVSKRPLLYPTVAGRWWMVPDDVPVDVVTDDG